MVARFCGLIKLEKVEDDKMKTLLENLPNEYAAMLGLCYNLSIYFFSSPPPSFDVLVRHPCLQDDGDSDPRGGDGAWRQDLQA